MEEAQKCNSILLVEATANQVNQFGGYMGMNPAEFQTYVKVIAERTGYPFEKVILGGDHLGPLTWQNENAESAMSKAKTLIEQFVQAGFTKIHIDTSMKLADDPAGKLSSETIAERGAILCEAAERVVAEQGLERPVYIIGSEVPTPGGAQSSEELKVTTKQDLAETVDFFKKSMKAHGLEEAWKNVIAFVVQPGVEFGSSFVHEYDHDSAAELIKAIEEYPDIAFEGHSTDYQPEQCLRQLVSDHVAILKVGPALTFALREGYLALELMEKELLADNDKLSHFSETLEKAMLKNPDNWIKHYKFSDAKNRLARKYSYSDRCRYYLSDNEVKKAIEKLLDNLSKVEIPMPLISQYMPSIYWEVRKGNVRVDPRELAKAKVKETLDMYYRAVAN